MSLSSLTSLGGQYDPYKGKIATPIQLNSSQQGRNTQFDQPISRQDNTKESDISQYTRLKLFHAKLFSHDTGFINELEYLMNFSKNSVNGLTYTQGSTTNISYIRKFEDEIQRNNENIYAL